MRRQLLGTLSVLLAVVLATLAVPAPASALSPDTFQTKVHRLTNGIRAGLDLPKLRKKACVQKFAVRQAKRMAAKEKIFHQDLAVVLKECGLSLVGENVAYGYATPAAVVAGWMDSPPHKANIVEKRYRQLGVGARKSDDGVWYVAQVFGRK